MSIIGEIRILKISLRNVFSPRHRKLTFVALAVATLLLFIWIPVKLTPGNDFFFQLSIMRGRDFMLFGLLSASNTLLILMQWHLYRARNGAKAGIATVAASSAGGISAVFASLLGTASCSACIAGLLGFLGTGSVVFFLKYSQSMTAAAIMIVAVAIWLAVRSIATGCTSCGVERQCLR